MPESEYKGLLRIPVERNVEFFNLLVDFYETNNDQKVMEFLYETSIIGKKKVTEIELEPIREDLFIRKDKKR